MRVTLLLLSALPLFGALPVPESHFGHPMGADRKLVRWADVVSYFRALDEASEAVLVDTLGRTTEGRPLIVAAIAAPETIASLERSREILGKLADPRVTRPEEVDALVEEGKPAIAITCSIHSTEVASTLTAVQFAYGLLSQDTPRHRAILANTILLLVPSLNPDGVDKVHSWYHRWLGTPHEGAPMTELYHKYAGHDNNRDWYIFSQAETRLIVERLHRAWRPQIVYDVHQMGPNGARIFVPPWIDPIDPNIEPLVAQQINAFGTAMAVDLTAAGKRGVLLNGIFDYYSPARNYPGYHGALRLLSESASARYASPIEVLPASLSRNGRGYSATRRSWNFLEPWAGGEWRLQDILDNQLITFESVLYSAALRRDELLRNFYRIAQRVVERGGDQAFVIPQQQHDPNAATRLVRTLQFGDIEVERALQDAGPPEAPVARAGDYVVRLAQPAGSFAMTLLDRQRYPDLRSTPGGPPLAPYDVTAHSLPLLMGVDSALLDSAGELETQAVPSPVPAAGRVDESDALSLAASFGLSWLAVNRLLAQDVAVHRRQSDGLFLIRSDEGLRRELRKLAGELGIVFAESSDEPSLHPRVLLPRVAVYAGHMPAIDEGWTRWLLDRYEQPYRSVGNEDVAAGLSDDHDVLILPDAKPEAIEHGYAHQYGAGESIVPPEYRAGLGQEGIAAIRDFARSGGTVLAFNRAAAFLLARLGLPVENAVRRLSKQRFYGPGTLVNVVTDLSHPLAFGLRQGTAAWYQSGPVFRIPPRRSAAVQRVMRYPRRGILASGWLLGEGYMADRTAVADVSLGSGRVILFGIRPQYRGQSDATFKMVLNGLHLNAGPERTVP